MEFDYMTRVRYHHVDKMNFTYYAVYLAWFEEARVEMLRHYGVSYKALEDIHRVFFPVSEAHVKYKRPFHFDEEVQVNTKVTEVRKASFKIAYQIFKPDKALATTGYTVHPVVDPTGRPVPLPDKLISLFKGADHDS